MPTSLVRLPSVDLIKGFVAVGRHMSITLAAEELCLTQSAVSRQVATLEATLGYKLLQRGYRSVSFTKEGETLFKAADAALQQLQEVVGSLDKRHQRRPVTVTASIGVIGLWLLPRLGSLHETLTDIDVRISTSNRLVDLRSEEVDIAIRYCDPQNAPTDAIPLFDEELLPVAHPSLGLRGRPPAQVLQEHVLLEFEEPKLTWLHWNHWLQLLGLEHVRPKGFIRFNQYDQLIHAAAAGRGIALGRKALVAKLIEASVLQPLDWDNGKWTPTHRYWLLLSEKSPRSDVRRVCDWIKTETSAMRP